MGRFRDESTKLLSKARTGSQKVSVEFEWYEVREIVQ
jgi:hypothetical protein